MLKTSVSSSLPWDIACDGVQIWTLSLLSLKNPDPSFILITTYTFLKHMDFLSIPIVFHFYQIAFDSKELKRGHKKS